MIPLQAEQLDATIGTTPSVLVEQIKVIFGSHRECLDTLGRGSAVVVLVPVPGLVLFSGEVPGMLAPTRAG